MNEITEKIIKQLGKYKYVLIVIICGIVLMNINFSPGANVESEEEVQEGFDVSVFESEIENALQNIEGVGRVSVTLSLDSSHESIYAQDIRSSGNEISETGSSYESNHTIISDNVGEEPIIIKSIYPKFRGAVIVCDGADNSVIKLAITEAISSLCDISKNDISIFKMKT